MPDCTRENFGFPSFDGRKIEASFGGGDVTSDAGVLLLRAADRRMRLVEALDAAISGPRQATHRQVDLLRQRFYGLALGYENLNDHNTLRDDGAWQTVVERDSALASPDALPARAADRSAYAEASRGGRPGIDPMVHFKMLMVGFFENLPSQRAIAALRRQPRHPRGPRL